MHLYISFPGQKNTEKYNQPLMMASLRLQSALFIRPSLVLLRPQTTMTSDWTKTSIYVFPRA
jgi:hypothetical protein